MNRGDNPDRMRGVVSPDFDVYAEGRTSKVRCAVCTHAPCDCPPFGSSAYMERLDEIHRRTNR